MAGVATTNITEQSLIDEVVGNREGVSVRQTVGDLSAQLLGSGPLGVQVAAMSKLRMPNPLYVAVAPAQSNGLGSNGSTSAYWPGEADRGLAFVYDPATTSWRDVVDMQGVAPFNPNGSNNALVHMAIDLARAHSIVVRMVMAVASGTKISAWTGGGYSSAGVLIDPYDRTISDANRVEFKKLTDAMAAMGIPRFHISVQIQGEADFSTPKAIYEAEVYFVHEEIGALGTIDAGDDWKFFTVLAGLYGGPDHTGQERRGRDLEAIARENPQSYVFAPVTGLICDLIGNPDGTLVHYDDLSLLRLGLRLSDAVRAQFLGVSQISDRRVDEMMVPATGPWGERMGHRTYEVLTVTDATYEPTIRGADLRYRGETVRFSGACTCNLDGGATATWSDGGAGFEFYQLSDTDSVLIKCYQDADNNHPVELVGAPSGVVGSVGLTISGQGRGRVFYQYNRWVIDWTPRRGPARGIRSLPGDASFTLSYLDGSYVLLDGTLTANRNCLLSSSGAVAGDIMSLRCGAGVGTYSWDIYDATVTTNLITLDSSTGLAEFVFDGAAWVPWRRGI